jgi:hypothetical protein
MASYYQRVKRTSGYTIMSNYHLRDMNLSLKASGLLSLVLSLPEDWQYSVKGLTAIVKEGESAVKSALQELEQHGYLRRTEIRTESGKFQGLEYIFLEYPGQLEDLQNPNGQKAPEVQLRGFCCINHEYISSFIAYRHYSICSSGMQYSKIEKIVIYFISCRTQSGNRKGVNRLDLITSFLVSVMAGVVSYYICKWLDRNDSDN